MITIIVPAHNEQKNLEKLLPNLNNLSGDNDIEVIVALSCTNSDASETIANLSNVRFIKCTATGRAAQMNHAANLARGNVLAFLHADVKPPKTFIADIERAIDNGCEAGFFSYRFDKKSFLLSINASFTSKDGIFTGGGDQCLFIKKVIFESLGRFDEHQVLMEDFEFFERMKKSKVRYKIIKNDLIVSARKYQNNSYLRVNVSNMILVLLFKWGYPPQKLKTLHNRLLRLPYQKHS